MVRLPVPHLTIHQERELYAGLIRASKVGKEMAHRMEFGGVGLREEFIQKIHKTIFEKPFPAIAGQYRLSSLEPFEDGYIPPSPERIRELMHTFVLDYTEQAKDLQPVHRPVTSTTKSQLTALIDRILAVSAFVHWRLVFIHPFTDGNGRTARILGNVVLQRYSLRPISIFITEKDRYLSAIHQANKFNLEPLKNLIAEKEYEELEKHGLPWMIEK